MKRDRRLGLVLVYSLTASLALAAAPEARVNTNLGSEQSALDGAGAAVDKLRSVDLDNAGIPDWGPTGRKAAKADILKFGYDAVKPLMSVLRQTLDKYQLDHRDAYKSHGPISIGGPPWVLILDCCELLGLLRAPEAVPLIAIAIERDAYFTLLPKIDSEVQALIRIGKPAAAHLVAEFQNCYQRVSLDRDYLPDDRRREAVEQTVYESQLQMSAALARIGDDQTIGELENLARSDVYMGRNAKSVIESTIATIKMRPPLYQRSN